MLKCLSAIDDSIVRETKARFCPPSNFQEIQSKITCLNIETLILDSHVRLKKWSAFSSFPLIYSIPTPPPPPPLKYFIHPHSNSYSYFVHIAYIASYGGQRKLLAKGVQLPPTPFPLVQQTVLMKQSIHLSLAPPSLSLTLPHS